jgi:RNA polymerase sigma-70 factor, ECF subfamily
VQCDTYNDHIISKSIQTMDRDEVIQFLLDEYSQSILWLAYTYVKDRGLAEDITQDVFLGCYNKLHTFKGESSIKNWLYRIATNRCKDAVKKWSFKKMVKVDHSYFERQLTNQKSPEVIAMSNDRDEELSRFVLGLPIKFREAIILYYFEDLSLEEISDMLNVKLNTVKTRLHRGRLLLRKIYDGGDTNGR